MRKGSHRLIIRRHQAIAKASHYKHRAHIEEAQLKQ